MIPDPVQFRIDQVSHYALWKLIFRRSWLRCFYVVIPIVVVFAVLGIVSDADVLDMALPVLAGVAAGGVFVGIQRLTLYGRAVKVYRESASLHELLTMSVSNEGFEFNQDSGQFRSLWRSMVKWDENDEILALFPNRLMAYILPKDQIPAAMQDFVRERIAQSGLDKRGKLRK